MTNDQPTEMRARLHAEIARRDVARGRPLTDQEKLENLFDALAESADTPCPLCGVRDHEPCAYEAKGETCKL